MAIAYKVLGQAHPATTADADLYTVPAATETIVSTLTITNVTGTAANARVWARINGAATAHLNAIIYDAPIAANTTAAFTLGLTLDATDIISVRSSVGNTLTFQLFGSEIS
jgi:hypothetical protein